jgi:hypothetical protein
MKATLKINLFFTKLAYALGLCKTYKIIYKAESNRFEPKEYQISRPFGKFFYKEDHRNNLAGEGITCYVPAVDDIRRFRLDRIVRFELIA